MKNIVLTYFNNIKNICVPGGITSITQFMKWALYKRYHVILIKCDFM